jgi:hypothetical protein
VARYALGAPIRLSTEVRDIAGVLANAGAITLTLLRPDGTTDPYATPTNASTGKYHQDIPAAALTQTGHYQFKWVSTGANAGVSSGAFDVADPFETELLSLDDAKQHLNITGTTNDAELEVYIAAVTEAIEAYIGPVGRRTITETVSPSSGVLLLSTVPVLSLTSVMPYASAPLTVSTLTVNKTAGIIYPGAYSGFWAVSYDVVYLVGRASVPASVNTAGRLVLQRLWETQRGGTTSPARIIGGLGSEEIGAETAAFSYVKSYGVRELLDPYRLLAGMA